MWGAETLKINKAKEGESLGIETLSKYESLNGKEKSFKDELKFYAINDIFKQTEIKQDGEKYMFIIDGKPKFLVNKWNLVPWIQQFYSDKTKNETSVTKEWIYVRLSEIKWEQTLESFKWELKDLQKNIETNQKTIERSTNIENMKFKVERLITFYEQERDLAKAETAGWFSNTKYDKKDKETRKIHKMQIERRIKELNKIKEIMEDVANNKNRKYDIKRDIDTKNGKNKDFTEVQMNDINGMDMRMTLEQLSDRIEFLSKEWPDFILTRNGIILEDWDNTPYYETIIHDKSDAKKINRSLRKVNKEYAILDELELTWAKRQELNLDLQALEAYLNNVISNPDTFKPSEHPFVPTHRKDFFELTKINPESLKQLNKSAGKNWAEEKPWNSTIENTKNNTEENIQDSKNTNNNNIPSYADKDYIDTFKKWWVTWVIRKTLNMFPNMTNEAKNTWTNLLIVGWVGYGIFKLGKWLFSGKFNKDQKEKTPFWQRMLIVGWVTLGFNAFGGNPFNTAGKFISGGLDVDALKLQWPWANQEKINNPEEELSYIEINEIFGTLPVGKLKDFVDQKTFKMTQAWYNGLLLNFQWTDSNSKQKREIIQKMRKNNDKDILKTSFAKVGITTENISNLDQNKTIKEYTESAVPTLEWWSDWDNVDDTRINITEQVKNFNVSEEQKKNLIKYGNILYKEKPGSSKEKVEFKEKDTKIYIKTYGERTAIDPEKLIISGYKKEDGTPIVFSWYQELLKSANLTNYMKSIFRGKAKGDKYNPFESTWLGDKLTRDRGDIMFNDGANKYNPIHTEAIDGGRFGTLGKISPKIEKNKEEYINYLNSLNIWNEKRARENKAE